MTVFFEATRIERMGLFSAAAGAGEGVGERRGGAQGVGLAHHFVVGKAPGIGGKAALLCLNLQEDARVANGGIN